MFSGALQVPFLRTRSYDAVVDSDCDVVAVVNDAARNGMTGCWTAVELLAHAFWGPVEPGHGIPDAELAAAEREIGRPLPMALREGYRQFGRLPLLSTQDQLIDPERLAIGATGDLSFRVENQGCAWWSCSVEDGDDPTVLLRRDDSDTHVDAGSVSQFFVHMVLSELVLGARYVADLGEWAVPPETLLQPLSVASFAWWPGSDLAPRRFLGGDGLILAADPTPWLWLAATSEHKLTELNAALAGP